MPGLQLSVLSPQPPQLLALDHGQSILAVS
jgi:hypothetical protein